MAELQITLEVFGDKILSRKLSRFGEGVSDFRPAFIFIVEDLRTATVNLFKTEGHGQWPPLSPKYAAWKKANFSGQPIMRASDMLYDSLIKKGRGGIEEIDKLTMRWGTNVPYARFHQKGAGHLPVRRVVHLVEDEKKAIVKQVQRYVVSMRDKADLS